MATVKSVSKARAGDRRPARAAAPRQAVPAPDLQKFLNSFKLPGVDLKSIVDGGHADLMAVTLANRRAYQGMQSLARRQGEMLRTAAADWRVAVKRLAATDADELLAQRTALAGQVISKTLANVRELAEASTRAQAEACEAAGARLREHLAGLKKSLPRR
jgi:phasin family protein